MEWPSYADELRRQSEQLRKLADDVTDRELAQRLFEQADEFLARGSGDEHRRLIPDHICAADEWSSAGYGVLNVQRPVSLSGSNQARTGVLAPIATSAT